MKTALLVVDVQNGFINEFTRHIPPRIAVLIARDEHAPVLFTRFDNVDGSPFRRLLGWEACAAPPDTDLAPEVAAFATGDRVYSKPG